MRVAAPVVRRITPTQLLELIQWGRNVTILDVREPAQYFSSPLTILGAVAIPPSEIARYYHQIPRERLVVPFATLPPEGASTNVARFLLGHGFHHVAVLAGGFSAWEALDFPTMFK